MTKRTTVILEGTLLKDLKQFALNNNETIASVIRIALLQFLHPHVHMTEEIITSPRDPHTDEFKREKYEE